MSREPPNLLALRAFNPNRSALGQLGLWRPQRVTLGALQTTAAFLQAAKQAIADQAATGVAPVIQSSGGTVTIVGEAPQGISEQATVARTLSNMSSAQLAQAQTLAENATAIQLMHSNATLASNGTPYLDPSMVDNDASPGPAPTYIALPAWPYASYKSAVDFPYPIPAPHWTTNLKWWTGQTLLNVGAPQFSNDPWEYLRSALIDSNMGALVNWCNWYTFALGRPAGGPLGGAASPWVLALSQVNLAEFKYILTTDGPVYFPFSYADLTAIQQATAGFEYGYSAATLATYLAQWVSNVLPNVSDFPESGRLTPMPGGTPYALTALPALYRQGTTFLASALPYIPVLTVVLAGALAAALVPLSGVGASVSAAAQSTAAENVANLAAQITSNAADISASVIAPTTEAIGAAAEVPAITLPDVIVTSTPLLASGSTLTSAAATTATLSAAAASDVAAMSANQAPVSPDSTQPTVGGSITQPTLSEVTVTPPTPPVPTPFIPPPIVASLTLPMGASVAALASNTGSVNFPSQQPATSTPSPLETSVLSTLATGIAKVIGGVFGGAVAAAAGVRTGVTTGTAQTGTTSAFGLSSDELIVLVIAAAAGLLLMTSGKKKPMRHRHHRPTEAAHT